MNESKMNVLLYMDQSQSAFFATVYSAMLLMNMPNMHLTVVQLKESNDGLSTDWLKNVIVESDSASENRNVEILNTVNDIFSQRATDVRHRVVYCNPSIPDAVDALLEYAAKKLIELIVMGTKKSTTLKDLIFGSLPHTLQCRSPIPVLLVKKLPQNFLDSYRSKPMLQVVRK